jgi:hypothetical protein
VKIRIGTSGSLCEAVKRYVKWQRKKVFFGDWVFCASCTQSSDSNLPSPSRPGRQLSGVEDEIYCPSAPSSASAASFSS